MSAVSALLSMLLAAVITDGVVAMAEEPKRMTPAAKERDGQHDFDFEIGTWKTHLRRRLRPLTGSNTWVELDGISVVRKVWDGKANLVELTIDLPDGGHFEGLSLRLYNPTAKQWSLNFVNAGEGTITPPTIGEFRRVAQWPSDSRSIRNLRHHRGLLPLRAELL
jgi:hypothetical protein